MAYTGAIGVVCIGCVKGLFIWCSNGMEDGLKSVAGSCQI
jgi:hypothetical protein